MASRKLQYIVDQKGRRRGVLLSVKDYHALLERIAELEDRLGLRNGVPLPDEFSFIGSGASGRGDISIRHDEALDDDFV